MDALGQLRRLFDHVAWADEEIIGALRKDVGHDAVRREYAHLLAAAAVWLDRILERPQRIAVWPDLSVKQTDDLRVALRTEYDALLSHLSADDLDRAIAYVNSAGKAFTNTIGDILLHVALHGQYHRGKVNLLLRQGEADPAPADFIAFVRGAATATEADTRRS